MPQYGQQRRCYACLALVLTNYKAPSHVLYFLKNTFSIRRHQ